MNPIRSTSNQNHPPIANFKYKPYYLDPTDQQTIQFTNTSYDPDGDQLSSTWLVDREVVSHEHDYSTKLPQGEHRIDLRVSDDTTETENIVITRVNVEPDQIFPTKQLHTKRKGVRYSAGAFAPEWPSPTPSAEEMDEQLDTIHDELGCNAIWIIAGRGFEDNLIRCAKLAITKGFERVYVQPMYMAASPEETVQKIGEFAGRVRALRQTSETVVYAVGHEFSLETNILDGRDWYERVQNLSEDWNKVTSTLPKMFASIVKVCKKEYGYEIAYAAAIFEVDLIPWENPIFESVCTDAYVCVGCGWTEDWVFRHLSDLKRYRKPVNSSEWGCMTYHDAGYLAASALASQEAYDEDEQANYVGRYCDLLNRAGIGGSYYTIYNDTYDKGYGLYNGNRRKKGFYAYKSYQRVT